MKLAIISNEHKLSGKLTKFFTDSYAYHVAWVDEEQGCMYDMNLIHRRRPWPHYSGTSTIQLFNFPEITREYLEHKLTHDESRYGVGDYCMFLLRPLFHLVGKSTVNMGGIICSEDMNIDMWTCGIETPFRMTDQPPSPADLERWVKTTGR